MRNAGFDAASLVVEEMASSSQLTILGPQTRSVALVGGRPANVELLHPDLGIDAPLAAAANRYDLDHEALMAGARAALAAPDRPVAVDVGVRSAA